MSYFPPHSSAEYGLSNQDFLDLAGLAMTLGPNWTVIIEYGDGVEAYARLMAPWSDTCASAFLIERQAGAVTVTDRLSRANDDLIATHPEMEAALSAIRQAILGRSSAIFQTAELRLDETRKAIENAIEEHKPSRLVDDSLLEIRPTSPHGSLPFS
jgi:hypothetical protein